MVKTGNEKPKTKNRILSTTELKSSIPKPLPCLRSNDSVRAKSASSCKSQPVRLTKIPVPFSVSTGRGNTSASLKRSAAPGKKPETNFHVCNAATFPSPLLSKKPGSGIKGPYANIQAKVNSIPKDGKKLKRETSPTNYQFLEVKETIDDISKVQTTILDISNEEISIPLNEETFEKKRQLITVDNERKKTLPANKIHPLEIEISRLMQANPQNLNKCIIRENSFLRPAGSTEYLDVFEKQMGEVTRLWLQMICELATMKLTMNHSALARINIPDPSLNAYEEVVKFFSSIPGEGEFLRKKLEVIEKEQQKVISVVMHNGLSLAQECETLKDTNYRLEKTQDKISEELNDKMDLLIQQNQELTLNHDRVVDKYNSERAKVEQQDKYKITINKEINETKKIIKCFEGKSLEWEAKIKKMEAACKSLEVAVRNRSIACDKETKQHRDILNKFNDAKQTISNLKTNLAEMNKTRMNLEVDYEKLKEEFLSAKASSDDLRTKRDELMEELSVKNKKLLEAEKELSMFQAYVSETHSGPQNNPDITSRIVMEDVSKDLQQRNLQIQQLKKELNRMEHLLMDKSTKEEVLLNQIAELQTKPRENEVVLKSQIERLHSTLKDLNDENVELEKMVSQKTLELDQRDQLMRQHKRALQARDELIPLMKDKQANEKECIERLHAVIYEHQTTYLNKGDADVFSSEMNPYLSLNNVEKGFLDPFKVERELAFRQEKMSELYSLLELKQMDVMKMERRVRELECAQGARVYNDLEKERRISALHRDITKTAKSRGFFSMLSNEDQVSPSNQ